MHLLDLYWDKKSGTAISYNNEKIELNNEEEVNHILENIKNEIPTLEGVFLKLTGKQLRDWYNRGKKWYWLV